MTEGLRLLSSLVSHGSTSTFRQLERDLFVGDDEQRMYDFVRRHFRTHSQMPALQTIAIELGLTIPTAPEPVDYYLERIRNRSMFNAVTPIYNDLHRALVDGDSETARQQIAEMHSACRLHRLERDLLGAGEVADEVWQHYDENYGRLGITGISTGWDTLDRETDGYQNGDLVVWAARPGVGKTHLLIHQCRHAWMQGKSVLFVSMEMTLRQIGVRLFSHMAGLDPNIVRRSKLSPWGERRLREATELVHQATNFWLYAGNMGKRTEDLDNVIQELNPDAIYLDGIYLMKPTQMSSRKTGDKYQNVSYVLDDLKESTIRRDRPIITTTQFNRAGAARPSLETLGYSDALGTHASIILGAGKDPNDRSARPSLRIVDIIKGREGEAGSFATNYRFAPLDFSEAPLPERTDEDNTQLEERLRHNRERFGNVGPDWTGHDEN